MQVIALVVHVHSTAPAYQTMRAYVNYWKTVPQTNFKKCLILSTKASFITYIAFRENWSPVTAEDTLICPFFPSTVSSITVKPGRSSR